VNKAFKKALQAAFEVQPPAEKESFLKQLHYPQITYQKFLWNQILYIRKRIWIISVIIVLLGWSITFRFPEFQVWRADAMKVWSISALLPFLAMITITEIYRSAAFHMEELEKSCRFDLTQIVMARMSILGVLNAVVVILFLTIVSQVSACSLLQIISYTMVPYLLDCTICLCLLKQMQGMEGIYVCAAVTGFVSVINIICGNTAEVIYSAAYLKGWLLLFTFCIVVVGYQIYSLVKQMYIRS
jgi:hypothetical protein